MHLGRTNPTAVLAMARTRVRHASRLNPQYSLVIDTAGKQEQREA